MVPSTSLESLSQPMDSGESLCVEWGVSVCGCVSVGRGDVHVGVESCVCGGGGWFLREGNSHTNAMFSYQWGTLNSTTHYWYRHLVTH